MKSLIIICIMVLISIFDCKGDDDELDYKEKGFLRVAICQLRYSADLGWHEGDSEPIESNLIWNMVMLGDWIHASKNSGDGNGYITYTIDPGIERVGYSILMSGGKMFDVADIIQKDLWLGADPGYFKVLPADSEYNLEFNGDGRALLGDNFKIRTNFLLGWSLVFTKGWLTCNDGVNDIVNGSGSGTFFIVVSPGAPDFGYIEVYYDGVYKERVRVDRI